MRWEERVCAMTCETVVRQSGMHRIDDGLGLGGVTGCTVALGLPGSEALAVAAGAVERAVTKVSGNDFTWSYASAGRQALLP